MVDRHRVGGHLRRDRGIAVPVAADPAAKTQEGRSRRAERRVERAKDLGHHAEERLVEDGHEGADLVQGLDLGRPHLGGAPQRVDLLAQPAIGFDLLTIGDPWIVEAFELLSDAADRGHDRTAPRLRRVSGEDRMELQAGHELGQALAAKPVPQLRDARGERLRERRRATVALPDHPGPMVLLGEVGEVEVARERARDQLGALELPGRDQPLRIPLEAAFVPGADHEPP